MRVIPSLGVSVAVIAALTGCGGSKLSHQSIEKLIVSELGNRGYPGVTVKCDDVDNKVGKKFTCTVDKAKGFTKIDGSVAKNDQINLDKVY
jgi:hypothetical protein